jgi:hypothetical protein
MTPINTMSLRKQQRFLHVGNIFLDLKAFESCDRLHMEEDQ